MNLRVSSVWFDLSEAHAVPCGVIRIQCCDGSYPVCLIVRCHSLDVSISQIICWFKLLLRTWSMWQECGVHPIPIRRAYPIKTSVTHIKGKFKWFHRLSTFSLLFHKVAQRNVVGYTYPCHRNCLRLLQKLSYFRLWNWRFLYVFIVSGLLGSAVKIFLSFGRCLCINIWIRIAFYCSLTYYITQLTVT